MIDLQTLPLMLSVPMCFAGGLGLGAAYFHALRLTADLIVQGQRPLLGLALSLGRVALLVGAFYVAVQAGGPALLAALAGVIIARAQMLRRVQGSGA